MATKRTTYDPRHQPAAITKQELRGFGKINPDERWEATQKMWKKVEAAARKAPAASSISSRGSTPARFPPSSPASSIASLDSADRTNEICDNDLVLPVDGLRGGKDEELRLWHFEASDWMGNGL
ncbi:hypothetical protein LTR56_014479 [Elasticomyces elasticus]|nr:hypothetical protein LTR56_014479 [Elasticomyces elasticus]KAK3646537.1 hypothetical protein LTR22_014300 [Elasticomyces elasticus]KAK4910436.1 hypothetical protein LTR49_020871 [Elasticomyces elasticus]KAK5755652.1 hypothetical protein LTS12_014213 [Elasticomyces elasticus]